MDFEIKNIKKNISVIAREIGYVILEAKSANEYNMVRRLGYDNYPRFHIYVKQRGEHFDFSLHLDQKQPSYTGTHAHAGEYEGPVVETEADRIKQILQW